ncbi:MAG: D-aminoacyl-tRNA deacylase [Candidatus Omnitrophica bacterium]|nr:D-aminoacyl-tRNA deacylase [Candidatus Omnitrophota bacterium]
MKVLLTRVREAEVLVNGKLVSSIGKGIAIFTGLEKNDDDEIMAAMAEKIVNLRVFENEQAKLDYSVKDKNYQILCISNFTLCATTGKGRRPSFEGAMDRKTADTAFENFVLLLRGHGIRVEAGAFGEYMDIRLNEEGPVNIILES